MYYNNFEKNITLKYRIVVQNWPLDKFVSPSDIGTSHELTTLLNAWNSNTACFQKLEGEEWKKWEDDYYKKESGTLARVEEVQDQRDPSPVPTPQENPQARESPASSSTPPLSSSVPAAAASTQAQASNGFVNTFAVLGANGQAVQVISKPRKKRKDAGVRRGQRTQNKEPEGGV